MTQSKTLLKKTRSDLLDIIGDPTYTTAFALLGAVRRYLRAAGPAGEPLSVELAKKLTTPHSIDALASALPHRRRADISRTLRWLQQAGEVDRTTDDVWWSKKSP